MLIKVRSWCEDCIAHRQKDTLIICLRDWFLLRGVITGKQPTGSYRRYADVFLLALRSPGLWLEPKEETCSILTFIKCCWALLTDVVKLQNRSWRRPHRNFANSLCKRSSSHSSVTTLIFYANAGEITTYVNWCSVLWTQALNTRNASTTGLEPTPGDGFN